MIGGAVPKIVKEDDSLWSKHLLAVGLELPVGEPMNLLVNGTSDEATAPLSAVLVLLGRPAMTYLRVRRLFRNPRTPVGISS